MTNNESIPPADERHVHDHQRRRPARVAHAVGGRDHSDGAEPLPPTSLPLFSFLAPSSSVRRGSQATYPPPSFPPANPALARRNLRPQERRFGRRSVGQVLFGWCMPSVNKIKDEQDDSLMQTSELPPELQVRARAIDFFGCWGFWVLWLAVWEVREVPGGSIFCVVMARRLLCARLCPQPHRSAPLV